ncbi:MAG: glycosyl hydrolase family 85, partial [Muribaculaceae bacterium]|nr:glycosyl hydrolase family 85 [Muribaculaceae bacterium]
IHESSNDYGTSDLAIQQAYLKKQELICNGGYGNPAVRPEINNNCGMGLGSITNSFHGFAEVMRAKSSIQQLPFVTRFCIGNGQKFYNRGEVAFDSKWYNLGTQDFLPSWRWWITDKNDVASSANLNSFVKAELSWDEAWFGGSCLSLSGATEFSRVKLFKTFLPVKASEELSIVYKPVGSADSHLKLFVSLKDAPASYKEIAVPAGKADEWNTFTAKLSDLGLSDGDIVLMGLVVENTTSDYKTLVGELALRDPAQSFSAVKPAVKEVEILRGRYNQVDFKMRYAAKEESGEEKTYNDEVDTWYYEIFVQQENQEPILLTATPSWAAYVIGAPLKSGYEGRRARFGVRAVSPNGDMFDNNVSDIAWSEYMDIPYNEILADLD